MKELPTGTLILIIVLAVIVLAVVLISVWAFIEPHILDVSTVRLRPAGKEPGFKKVPASSSPSDKPGLRLFFFSDLHAELCMIKPDRLVSAIREAHKNAPLDAVVFGGDICNSYDHKEKGLSYLNRISDVCSELGIPFYGVTGNHDLEFDPSDRKCHFESIENKMIDFASHTTGKRIILCGTDDSGRKKRVWNKVPPVPADCVSVLVAHNPDSILHFEKDEHVDFMLSGHFHGGQLKLPFHLEFVKLRSGELPRQEVIEGVFEHKGISFFITRGLGCNALPIRLRSIPEASVVEFYI